MGVVAAVAGVALAAVCGLLLWRGHGAQVRTERPLPGVPMGRMQNPETSAPLPGSAEITFHLARMIENSAGGFAERARAKGLHFTTAVGAGVPPVIRADRSSLEIVLANLLDNAVKFTDEGAVRLEAVAENDDAGKPQVRFNVYDTGAGMDADRLKQILQSNQGFDSDSRRGLAVVHRLLARMGGNLKAESEPRGGSTFWFRIPMTAAEPVYATAPPAAIENPTPLLLRAAHPGKRVLIVDSSLAAQVAILWGVRTLGYYGEAVSCVAEALEAWQHKPFDLVVLDCEMQAAPEIVRSIRRLETGCIPIVAVNREGDQPSISIDSRLGKPVCLLALARALDHWLGDAAPVFANEASSERLSLPV